jgi:EmrB/QacA subfamily drug resistance transporter
MKRQSSIDVEPRRSPKHALLPWEGRSPWAALAVVLTAAFVALLDTTIVNVALPSLQAGVHGSESTLEWVVAGYALAFGVALIPAGRAGDRLGLRPLFIGGLALFTISSVACAVSQAPWQIVAARVVQGLAAGAFFPTIGAVIQSEFSEGARSKAFGLFGAVIGVATAVGPVLGGLLIEWGGFANGWRWVFLVNLPICVPAILAALRILPAGDRQRGHGSDRAGLILLVAALLCVLIPLVEGPRLDWPGWTYISLAASVLLFVGLALWEVRLEHRGGEPLVAPSLMRLPAFAAGTGLSLVYFASFTSIFFTFSILWQVGLGHSAIAAGLAITPFALGTMAGGAVSDVVSARLGRLVLVLGAGMVTVGLTLTLLVLALQSPRPHALHLLAPFLLIGLGNGLFIAPNVDFVLAGVPVMKAGAANGVLATAQRVGSSIGIAVIGTVLFNTLSVRSGPDAVARAFVHSSILATSVNLGLVLLAMVLIFALPRRAARS